MARTSMKDLHNILFEAMERTLNPDEEAPISVDQVKSLVVLAETVIDAGRAETEYIQVLAELPQAVPSTHTALFLQEGK